VAPRVIVIDEGPAAVAGKYQRILELAWPYLHTRSNDEHTEGSVLFAWQLLDAEGGDPDVVIPAIILHDVGWSRLSDDEQRQAFGPPPRRLDLNIFHEQQGAEIAAGILASIGYDPALTDEIVQIINGHDNRPEALSLNDSLVKDADRLFRLTRRGYLIFLEFFSLEFRSYLAAMASVADNWYFTATARRLGAEMFADLEVYIGELESAEREALQSVVVDATPAARSAP
jgi:HD superfamily phosphodiesterase